MVSYSTVLYLIMSATASVPSVLEFSYWLRDHTPTLHLPDGSQVTVQNGYYSAKEICKAVGDGSRKVYHWYSQKSAQNHVCELEELMGRDDLYQSGPDGTWIHPVLVLHLTKWLCSKYGKLIEGEELFFDFHEQFRQAQKRTAKSGAKPQVKPRAPLPRPLPRPDKKAENKPEAKENTDEPSFEPMDKKYEKESKVPVAEEVTEIKTERVVNPEFSALIPAINVERPLDEYPDIMPIMDFAQWALERHQENVDRKFIKLYVKNYHNLSWNEQKTSCCINIEKLLKQEVYSNKRNAKKNLQKHGFQEGKDWCSRGSTESERKFDHGGQTLEIITLTPDCFKQMCLGVYNEAGKKIRTYYLLMEKVVNEYVKYEREYAAAKQEFFKSGSAGNSQAVNVIKTLREELDAKTKQLDLARQMEQQQEEKLVELRHQVEIRDEKLNTLHAQFQTYQAELKTHQEKLNVLDCKQAKTDAIIKALQAHAKAHHSEARAMKAERDLEVQKGEELAKRVKKLKRKLQKAQ